jgi:multicomponent Na+:H+ antiporter subunit D
VLFVTGIGFAGGPGAQAFGLALMAAGALMRSGLAPLHAGFTGIVTDHRSSAPALAATALALAALAILLRLAATAPNPALGQAFVLAMAVIGSVGAVYAALQAAGAASLRAFLGLSLSAQLGCVLIGFAADPAAGLAQAAALVAIAIGLLAAIDALAPLDDHGLDGAGRRAPLAAASLSVAGLSIAGAPLTAGFLSKWLLIEAVLQNGWWPAAAAIVLTALLAIAAVGRLIERLYFADPTPANAPTAPLPAPQPLRLLALVASIAASLALGLNAAGWISWARFAAAGLAP